ncbi:hypothetical protein AB0C52_08975 [Streptomyces sp. NPDC048717]|uniref:hypothetical protein n=1 Tax=Streptomyces sp. NPDC048717 TaxID=3154928 RepID=UPI003414A71F
MRGPRESVIFQNLALSLIAEIEAVLTPRGRPAADAGPGARVVYFAHLGLLMTFANGDLGEPRREGPAPRSDRIRDRP